MAKGRGRRKRKKEDSNEIAAGGRGRRRQCRGTGSRRYGKRGVRCVKVSRDTPQPGCYRSVRAGTGSPRRGRTTRQGGSRRVGQGLLGIYRQARFCARMHATLPAYWFRCRIFVRLINACVEESPGDAAGKENERGESKMLITVEALA